MRMQRHPRSAVLFALVLAMCTTQRSDGALLALTVTPVQKVLDMLAGMIAKGGQEKHEEEVRFAAFTQWCTSVGQERERSIQAAANAIMQLDADLAKAEADAEQLAKEADELASKSDAWQLEAKQAGAQRKDERATYDATNLDYKESIDALERAIQVLKARRADVLQPKSLLQLRKAAYMPLLPPHTRRALLSFLEGRGGDGDDALGGVPEANAYEFQSESIVDMLQKLRLRFVDERQQLEREETNRRHAYELLATKLRDDIGYAGDARSKKVQMKARRLEDAADAKGNLAETTGAKEADNAYLRDLRAQCEQKSQDFKSRQALREEELEALRKAVEIISSPMVAGAAQTHLPAAALWQAVQGQPRAVALMQLRSSGGADHHPAEQVSAASFLMNRAGKVGSTLLATVAARVGEDPFAKVKKMIKDLLVRLMEEANNEADHKAWCDEEISANKATRDTKSAEASDLASRSDELQALEAKLSQEIADLHDAIASIDKAVGEATKARAEEKDANDATLRDARAAQAAVAQAIEILKEFQSRAAESTTFVQQTPAEDAPETFDKAYTGMQGASGGVIGMLEVIESDFARLEANTVSSEEGAQGTFKKFTEDSAVDKAVMEKESRHKGFDKERTARSLHQARKDLEETQAELDAALEYYNRLRPSCIDTGNTYEDRVQRRREEIQSLQEALQILNGEDLTEVTAPY